MKLLFEVLAPIAFFVAYKLADIYVAAGVAMAIAALQIVGSLVLKKRISPLLWTSAIFTLIFGTATILFRDEWFIKLKWTLFYGLAGGAILVGTWLGKSPLKALIGSELELPDIAWRKLNWMWGGFFVLMAVLNTYFALTVSLDAWVKIKVFGGLALSVVFAIVQGMVIAKHMPDENQVLPAKSDQG